MNPSPALPTWKHPLTVDWSKSVDHLYSILDADGSAVFGTNDKDLAEMLCEALRKVSP